MCGAVRSSTVKLVTQVLVLLAASTTVTVMGCVPSPTFVPAAGSCDLLSELAGVQLSEAMMPVTTFGMGASQLESAELVVAPEQPTVGGSVSVTATVNEQLATPQPLEA